MHYDIQSHRIFAYPYLEYKAGLNKRSQALLTEQYEQSIQNNQMVIFERNNKMCKLRSFSIDLLERKTVRPHKTVRKNSIKK